MTSLTVPLEREFEQRLEKFPWINWSELSREILLEKEKLQEMLAKLETKEEQEFIKWSVDLGRKAKKESFKRLIKEFSPKKRKDLLSGLSPKKREKLLEYFPKKRKKLLK